MGKKEKRQRQRQKPHKNRLVIYHHHHHHQQQEEADDYEEYSDSFLPSSAYNQTRQPEYEQKTEPEEEEEEEVVVVEEEANRNHERPCKFLLYQKSVQSPKGDISYLQKFFLMYVGGRLPLHLQEDFCGTALLSVEWLRSDPRRTAVGVDLDLEALTWCLENNVKTIGVDVSSRLSLFHGNVLQPNEAGLVKHNPQDLIKNLTFNSNEGCLETIQQVADSECAEEMVRSNSFTSKSVKNSCSLPARDIVCAFNYSCCCLQNRRELVLYFRHALSVLSKRGGVFVMDLYGGTSSERELKLQRRFSNFTYVWEQEQFDIVNRTTRISLHFHLGKNQGTIRHAFTYHWHLWSLPEIKDCLEEAGFKSVHFWIREMPNTHDNAEEFNAARDMKYEEVSSFQQVDAWNAYVVAVAN